MLNKSVSDFLINHNMDPQNIDPSIISDSFCEHIEAGLSGNIIDLPMIPTYLNVSGKINKNEKIIVIDAGGTNYRSGLAEYDGNNFIITDIKKCAMPGTYSPISWDDFISFIVDSIECNLSLSDKIGFCFSYDAEITPECDGRVHVIDKEVVINGCEGKLIGESINIELEKRGYAKKHIVIINDTVAALLGGSSSYDTSVFSDMVGMICGTGFNMCMCYNNMIYNMEAGFFNNMPFGNVDRKLDKNSNFPGNKLIEKMISGAYIGPLCKELICMAAEDGYISSSCRENIQTIDKFDGSCADDMASGTDIFNITDNKEDLEFISQLCCAAFERSARSVASAMIGVIKFNQSGTDSQFPAAFFAEGSLISKSKHFKEYLDNILNHYAKDILNINYRIYVGSDTTLPGAAMAALLNT